MQLASEDHGKRVQGGGGGGATKRKTARRGIRGKRGYRVWVWVSSCVRPGDCVCVCASGWVTVCICGCEHL